MSSDDRKAHALSLHLFSILDKYSYEKTDPLVVLEELGKILKSYGLEEHLAVRKRESDNPGVVVEPLSSFGDEVLLELYSRCESFPCPSGECKDAERSFCHWCVRLKT